MKQEKKNSRVRLILVMIVLLAALLAAIFLTDPGGEKTESIQAVMKDAVLHEDNQMAFLGMQVNPSVISDWVVTGLLLVVAALLRIFAIPHFKLVPGKLQSALEALVSFFRDMAKSYSPHRNGFLGVYIFSAGMYIAVGTLFELLGIQSVTTEGMSMSLPAPLSDINAAIAMGLMSYGVIMSGGIASNGGRGILLTLKEFSLPISMSFRLFGALLSGLLVSELVYYTISLSFVLPVLVGVLFTILHALIQTYVLTMLTANYYGEVSEPPKKKVKKEKKPAGAVPAVN